MAGASPGASAPSSQPSGVVDGLTLEGGTLVLPAVRGHPGAAYFTVGNSGNASRSIGRVTVAGASAAQMHETNGGGMTELRSVPVPSNGEIRFAPGGKHVMVFGVPATLHPGDAVRMTLTFDGGDVLSTSLSVKAPGAAADAMSGMHM